MHHVIHTCENVRLCAGVIDANASDFLKKGIAVSGDSRFSDLSGFFRFQVATF